MRSLLLFSPLLLVACASTQPVIKTEVQYVQVPVAVPCKVDIPSPPEYAFPNLKPEHDIYVKTKVILADRRRSIAYEAELLAALTACTKSFDK